MNLNRRTFLKGAAIAGASFLTSPLTSKFLAKASASGSKPNIIFVLADDLGWAELGCYGNTYNETPNLDALAANGIRFTDGYASGPVCSPCRTSLMTGQVPARVGIYKWLDRYDYDKNLSRNYTTIAEQLKAQGYATGIVGKWHLSCYADDGDPDPVPAGQQGFDEDMAAATKYIGNGDYWWPYNGGNNTIMMPELPRVTAGDPPVEIDLDPNYPGDEYLVDRCNYEALGFIERHKTEPFFLYLSHYAVHTTLDGKPGFRSLDPDDAQNAGSVWHFESKPGSGIGAGAGAKNPHLASQLYWIDEGIGRIIDKLTQNGLLNNTLIVFMGDNGGATGVTNNTGLRAGKGSLYEGGTRVPFIMSLPGQIQAGAVCSEPVWACDFFPTFTELVSAQLPFNQLMDGTSLVPLFTNPQGSLNRVKPLCWYYPASTQSSIRKDDWKLVERIDTGAIELYNLAQDLAETTDLKTQYPAKAMELLADLRAWRSSIGRFWDKNGDGGIGTYELSQIAENWLN